MLSPICQPFNFNSQCADCAACLDVGAGSLNNEVHKFRLVSISLIVVISAVAPVSAPEIDDNAAKHNANECHERAKS
jgi:hypothetical protein